MAVENRLCDVTAAIEERLPDESMAIEDRLCDVEATVSPLDAVPKSTEL